MKRTVLSRSSQVQIRVFGGSCYRTLKDDENCSAYGCLLTRSNCKEPQEGDFNKIQENAFFPVEGVGND